MKIRQLVDRYMFKIWKKVKSTQEIGVYILWIFCILSLVLKGVVVCFRPGGELNVGEEPVAGLKRLLTEVWQCPWTVGCYSFISGMWLSSQLANFSQFLSKFCHLGDQCKSSEKMFPFMGVRVFTALGQPFKCYDYKSFLRIIANFVSGQSRLCTCALFSPI